MSVCGDAGGEVSGYEAVTMTDDMERDNDQNYAGLGRYVCVSLRRRYAITMVLSVPELLSGVLVRVRLAKAGIAIFWLV